MKTHGRNESRGEWDRYPEVDMDNERIMTGTRTMRVAMPRGSDETDWGDEPAALFRWRNHPHLG